MTTDLSSTPAVGRRRLLRGSALLAGAAGAGLAAAAAVPTRAAAADGDTLRLGQSNDATADTRLTVAAGTRPALTLSNTDGPSLKLSPIDEEWDGDLEVGEIANTAWGPMIGLDFGSGAEVGYLATDADLAAVPLQLPVGPVRILDTRTASGRGSIVGRAPSALDSSHRLRSGKWLDVGILPSDLGIGLLGVHVTLSAINPTGNGSALVYPPGPRPTATTLWFSSKRSTANSALVGAQSVAGTQAIRIHTSRTTHLTLDITGLSLVAGPGFDDEGAGRGAAAARRHRGPQASAVARARQAVAARGI